MKKIGEGYYYTVHDVGNNRVIKKLKTNFRLFIYILYIHNFNIIFYREYKNAIANLKNIQKDYERLKKLLPDFSRIGNPTFLHGINYEQDKVLIFKDLLKERNENQIKNLIDEYIDLIKYFWSYGIDEKVYNFTLNTGITIAGDLILIDFNEVNFDKVEAKEGIINEIWLKRWSYSYLPPTIKVYYKTRMGEEITLDNLELLWNSKISK
jgi:hypothetical protein